MGLPTNDNLLIDNIIDKALAILGFMPDEAFNIYRLTAVYDTRFRVWKKKRKDSPIAEAMRFAFEVLKPFATEEVAPVPQILYSDAEKRLQLFNSLADKDAAALQLTRLVDIKV